MLIRLFLLQHAIAIFFFFSSGIRENRYKWRKILETAIDKDREQPEKYKQANLQKIENLN